MCTYSRTHVRTLPPPAPLTIDATIKDSMEMVALMYWLLILCTLVTAIVHAALARNVADEKIKSSLITVILLMFVLMEFATGCVNLAYACTSKDKNYYNAAVVCQALVTTGTSMILSFLVTWSHYGNVVEYQEMKSGKVPV